jgi:hypothetical protein
MKTTDLTKDEQASVRAALRFLRARCGGWANAGKALRFGDGTLSDLANGRGVPSPLLAFRIARLAKVGVDDVLAGRFPPAGTCPHCGHARAEPTGCS